MGIRDYVSPGRYREPMVPSSHLQGRRVGLRWLFVVCACDVSRRKFDATQARFYEEKTRVLYRSASFPSWIWGLGDWTAQHSELGFQSLGYRVSFWHTCRFSGCHFCFSRLPRFCLGDFKPQTLLLVGGFTIQLFCQHVVPMGTTFWQTVVRWSIQQVVVFEVWSLPMEIGEVLNNKNGNSRLRVPGTVQRTHGSVLSSSRTASWLEMTFFRVRLRRQQAQIRCNPGSFLRGANTCFVPICQFS